jgi:hypothetical protein
VASNDIIVRLRAAGQAAFQSAMDSAAGSITGLGKAAETTTKQTDEATAAGQRSGRTWRDAAKGVAKWAGSAAAIYGAQKAIHSAVDATEQLASATRSTMRVTNMDAETASAWTEIMRVRGVSTSQQMMSMKGLARAMQTATQGGKKQQQMFARLGVTSQQFATGDVQGVLMKTADAFQQMTNPAEKAAFAQQLFGRTGLTLLPLLNQGSAGIKKQMDMAKQYGATLDGDAVEGAKNLAAKQFELKYAMDGLKVSLGEALLPTIQSVVGAIAAVTKVMQPLLRNATAMKIVIGAVAYAFVLMKVNALLAAFGMTTLNASILLIPLAIAAVIAGLVILYNKWAWFHRAVDNTFAWIKSHWPLLLVILTGPFGAATVLIIRNIGKIKAAAGTIAHAFRVAFDAIRSAGDAAVHWIADRFRQLVDFVKNIPSALGSLPGKAWKAVTGRQHGGIVRTGELTLVGERGPELVQLPGGSRVTPLPRPALSAASPVLAGVQTTANFYLDRRLLGTAVAQDTSDRKARR